jgi:hypothetical protein
MGAGTKFQPISVPPEDAQFIESRKFQIRRGRPHLRGAAAHAGDTEKSTSWGTGIEQQSIGFVVYTLRPWLIRFEQRLSRLLPNPQYAKFTVEGLLRGDSLSGRPSTRQMWNIGACRRTTSAARGPAAGRRRRRPLPPAEHGRARPARPPATAYRGAPDA